MLDATNVCLLAEYVVWQWYSIQSASVSAFDHNASTVGIVLIVSVVTLSIVIDYLISVWLKQSQHVKVCLTVLRLMNKESVYCWFVAVNIFVKAWLSSQLWLYFIDKKSVVWVVCLNLFSLNHFNELIYSVLDQETSVLNEMSRRFSLKL